MKIQNILVLLFLLCLQSLSANKPTEKLHMPRIVFSGEFNCNLQPPAFLNVDAVGPDWVEVSWPLVIGAAQYRLQAYDATNGDALASPILVSGTTTNAIVSTVGNDGSVFVRIWSVCENGSFNWDSYRQSATFDTIIAEIVVTGFTEPAGYCPNQTVGITSANGVSISWSGQKSYFLVSYPGETQMERRGFDLLVKSNTIPNEARMGIAGNTGGKEPGNLGEKIVFDKYFEDGVSVRFLVRYRENPQISISQSLIIAELEASHATPTAGLLYKKGPFDNPNNDPDCSIKKYNPCPMQGPDGVRTDNVPTTVNQERSNIDFSSTESISARPNPFRDAITVQLPQTKSQDTRMIHLYDLLGARRMSYQIPANQIECTLNTSLLTPGVYFLRIEVDGKMETLKLLKTN